MKKVAPFLIFALFINLCIVPVAARAEDEGEYSAWDKFTRGISNCLTFPVEIPIAVYKTSVEQNPVMGLLYGLPLGIGRGGIRMVAGLVELTTFPFPPYEPIVKPESLF